MDSKLLKEINNWDFSSYVPKVVIFDDSKSESNNNVDYLYIDFLNYIGMDVAVVSPSGKNSINSFNFELNKDLLSNIIQDKFKEAPTLTYSEQESKKESRNKILMGTSLGLLGFSAVVGGVVGINNAIESSNKKAVAEVVQMIDDIGTDISLDDYDDIMAAKNKYDSLYHENYAWKISFLGENTPTSKGLAP